MLILIITQEPETQTQDPEADQEIPRPHAATSTLWLPQEASATVTHFSLPTASPCLQTEPPMRVSLRVPSLPL